MERRNELRREIESEAKVEGAPGWRAVREKKTCEDGLVASNHSSLSSGASLQ
jgi:hypothetical protein